MKSILCRQSRSTICGVILGFGVLAGCDSIVEPNDSASSTVVEARVSDANRSPREPRFKAETPQYPAPVVYILYREFLHKNPNVTSLSPDNPKYQAYMERRLRELYPARGYSGMMRDAVAEMRENEAAWRAYEAELRTYEAATQDLTLCEPVIESVDVQILTTSCTAPGGTTDPLVDPSWTGKQEFSVPADHTIPTIPMEIDTLRLVGLEVDRIYYYESLATGTFSPIQIESVGSAQSIDDLIRAAGEGRVPGSEFQAHNLGAALKILAVGLGIIGWKAHRIEQAGNRALKLSEEYYPHLVYDDTKRDAHRHIFLSMMLRRYVGAEFAKALTDSHEYNSTGPAHVMDLHNNDIGRSYRYERFRKHWFWDRWDWQEWGRRVRDYVNEPTHAAYIPQWKINPPTTAEARAQAASVSHLHYIYFVE